MKVEIGLSGIGEIGRYESGMAKLEMGKVVSVEMEIGKNGRIHLALP